MIAMLSEWSIVVIAGVLVLLFGGSQLPKLARNVGTAGKEFRNAQAEADAEAAAKEAAAQAAAPAAIPAAPVVAPPVAAPPVAAAPVAPAHVVDDRVTLSRSELDALLDEREARAKGQSAS